MDNITPQDIPANIQSISADVMGNIIVVDSDGGIHKTSSPDMHRKLLEAYHEHRHEVEWQGDSSGTWDTTLYVDGDKVVVTGDGRQRVSTGQELIGPLFGAYSKMRSRVFWQA